MAAAYQAHALLRPFVGLLREPPAFHEYAALAFSAAPVWLLLIAALGLHRSFERLTGRLELFVDLLKLHVAGFIATAVILFFSQGVINRSLVAMFFVCSFASMFVLRSVLQGWVRYQHRTGNARLRLLVVGAPTGKVLEFVRDASADTLRPEIVGYLGQPSHTDSSLEHLGPVGRLGEVLHGEAIDHVVFFPPHNRPEDVTEALSRCEELGVSASFAVDLIQLSAAIPRIGFLYDRPFIEFDVAPKRPAALAVKHGLDIVAAACGILLLLPLLIALSIAIAISMGRPVLFHQERAGLYGRRFRMLKFRTMVADAEDRRAGLGERNEMTGPVFKLTDDPRVTRLGRFLRRSSLDELPQLFNVLTGAMSLVGPRPLPAAEQQQIVGWRRRRLSMKPGITGLWQVSGRNDIDFEEWMALDLRYIDDWSLGLDLRILLRTIPAVMRGKGAH